MLATDGGFAPDGRFAPLPNWDATLLMGLFREGRADRSDWIPRDGEHRIPDAVDLPSPHH
jgi:hypothetical protein